MAIHDPVYEENVRLKFARIKEESLSISDSDERLHFIYDNLEKFSEDEMMIIARDIGSRSLISQVLA